MATRALPIGPEAKAVARFAGMVFGVDPDNVAGFTVEYEPRRVTFDLIDGPNARVAFECLLVRKESR